MHCERAAAAFHNGATDPTLPGAVAMHTTTAPHRGRVDDESHAETATAERAKGERRGDPERTPLHHAGHGSTVGVGLILTATRYEHPARLAWATAWSGR